MRGVVAAVATVICVAALAGCSAPAAHQTGGSGAPASGEFVGPWADLFAATSRESTSADERAALADSEIDAQEYAYFQDKIVSCLTGLGIKDARFDSDGSLSYTVSETASREAIRDCNSNNGIRVISLRDAIVRNPDNLDETQIVLDCLKRTGAVGSGYSRADLDNGVDLDALGKTPEFVGCTADPLNYGTKG